MRERSQRGQPATAAERHLVDDADLAELRDPIWRWAALAQRVGLDAILAVLDAFGGEQVKVVSRRGFLDAIERLALDRLIAARHHRGEAVCTIAAGMNLSRRRVRLSLRRSGVYTTSENAVKAAG